jgi:hypothetical protein
MELEETGLSQEEAELLERTLEEAHSETIDIPLNSKSVLIDDSVSRFSSAEWFSKIQQQRVILAGLGGIGSYVAFLLSRMKIAHLMMYDDDIVDATNMSGQLYGVSSIGKQKCHELGSFLVEYSRFYNYCIYNRKYTGHCNTANIMICGFDNMDARKTFYYNWRGHIGTLSQGERENCLFIDGRLAAEEFQVFCIKGTDTYYMDKYEKEWLFSDEESEQTVCSYKQTSFCANMIASVMVNLFTNFVANQCNPLVERELPFFTYYNAERMLLKTE